jgi:Type IV secretion-system coupling protein DNA-binding domain
MIHFLGKELFADRDVAIRDRDLAGHVHVLGQSGMGKSTLIEQIALQRARQGRGFCFIDPHGQSAEHILDRIPAVRTKDVLYINPANDYYGVGLNLLEKPSDPNDRGVVASEVMRMFHGIFADSWGVRLEQVLRNTILALLEQEQATLLSIRRMLVNEQYRAHVLRRVRNHVVLEYWRDEFGKYPERMIPEVIGSTLNKIDPFISDDRMRRIVGQPRSRYDYKRGMESQQIIIANLSKSKIGTEQSKYLGSMLITKLVIEARKREEQEALENVYPLIVDEVQNFGTDVLTELVAEARKGGLALIASHQYLDQFEQGTAHLKKALMGGTQAKVIFQLGIADAEQYAQFLSTGKPQTDWTATELQNLGPYRAVLKGEGCKRGFRTMTWDTEFPGGRAGIIERESSFAYGKSTRVIEAALGRFYERFR